MLFFEYDNDCAHESSGRHACCEVAEHLYSICRNERIRVSLETTTTLPSKCFCFPPVLLCSKAVFSANIFPFLSSPSFVLPFKVDVAAYCIGCFGQDEQHVLEVEALSSMDGARRLQKLLNLRLCTSHPPFLPVYPPPIGTMRPIIEKDLGKRVTEVFSSINTVPLASASIAQVRSGVLARPRYKLPGLLFWRGKGIRSS